jgi:formylglycine-generating enzyme required for sulfatase activity
VALPHDHVCAKSLCERHANDGVINVQESDGMSRIFISYRRSDSAFPSDSLYRELVKRFGKEAVFKDVDNIPLGADFQAQIESEIAKCSVLLVVIGPGWLNTTDEQGRRRIDDPTDFVHIEIATALQRKITVIPLLLDSHTPMPKPTQLPISLRHLSRQNGMSIRPATDWDRDIERLVKEIKSIFHAVKSPETPNHAASAQHIPIAKPKIVIYPVEPVIHAPSMESEQWLQVKQAIDLHRPTWLKKRLPRNECLESITGPNSGGCLVQLLPPPVGIERKVILARDGSPLIEMVKIPAGKFIMGSNENDPYASRNKRVREQEMPQQHVFMDAYWIARTPVTNYTWQKFVDESGYQPFRYEHNGSYLKHMINESPPNDHPVVFVSYINAWAFCDFYGLMLPSEAQWEKAARGTDGRIWPWGNNQPTRPSCNYDMRETTSVSQHPDGCSPYGLYGCAGNVWEWCADAWERNWLEKMGRNMGEIRNPVNVCADADVSITLRGGGAFDGSAMYVRCAYRGDGNNDVANRCRKDYGFRPAQVTGL